MTHIEACKEELICTTDKWLRVIINIMHTTKKLKSKVILNLKQYMHCYVALNKVFKLFQVELCLLNHNSLSH